MQEIPLVLSSQAYKSAATHILCEMPGILDLSATISQHCSNLVDASVIKELHLSSTLIPCATDNSRISSI